MNFSSSLNLNHGQDVMTSSGKLHMGLGSSRTLLPTVTPVSFSSGDLVDGLCALPNGSQRWFPGEIVGLVSSGVYLVHFKDGEQHHKALSELRYTKRRGEANGSSSDLMSSTRPQSQASSQQIAQKKKELFQANSSGSTIDATSLGKGLASADTSNGGSFKSTTPIYPVSNNKPNSSQPSSSSVMLPRHPNSQLPTLGGGSSTLGNLLPAPSANGFATILTMGSSPVSPSGLGVAEMSLQVMDSPRSVASEGSDMSDTNVFVIPSVFEDEENGIARARTMTESGKLALYLVTSIITLNVFYDILSYHEYIYMCVHMLMLRTNMWLCPQQWYLRFISMIWN